MSRKLDITGHRGKDIKRPIYSLHDAILRLLDSAIETLSSHQNDKAVHTARTAAKRIRAAFRLMRECLGPRAYRRENRRVRDAAKPLTAVRDAFMLRGTLRSMPKRPVRLERGLKSKYQRERQAFKRQGLQAALRQLKATRKTLSDLFPVAPETASVVKGVSNTYRAGRKAMAKAKSNDDQALHEWRKQAKYLLNQLELLAAVFDLNIRNLRRRADKLADILGDDHDLSVLSAKLCHYDANTPRLIKHIEKQRRHLQHRAAQQGKKLYRQSAKRIQATIATHLWSSNLDS